jgi:hypothetical protein
MKSLLYPIIEWSFFLPNNSRKKETQMQWFFYPIEKEKYGFTPGFELIAYT